MKDSFKILGLLIAILLIISTVYVGYVIGYDEPEYNVITKDITDDSDEEPTDDPEDTNETDEEDPDDEEDPGKETGSSFVFIEDATSVTCEPCVEVGEHLYDFYQENESDFYFVSMVYAKSDKATSRLVDDYNVQEFPIVYFDGGYKIVKSSNDFENNFKSTIQEAHSRDRHNLKINFESEWNETRKELENNVLIENKESTSYTGTLRVYITEKISTRWSDAEGNPYRFAFIDFATVEDISIAANENKSINKIWDADSAGFADVYPENLYVVAVVFNSEKHQGYSKPETSEAPFDSYYVDACAATDVSEGTLPPGVGITTPQVLHRYVFDKDKGKANLLLKTILIGKTTFELNIQAEAGIEKVEYQIIGKNKDVTKTVESEPYSWKWDFVAFGTYTVKVTVYDLEGRTATDEIEVLIFTLGL